MSLPLLGNLICIRTVPVDHFSIIAEFAYITIKIPAPFCDHPQVEDES